MNWLKYSSNVLVIFFLILLFNISLKGQDIMIESENVQTSLNGTTTAGFISLSFHPETYPIVIEYTIPGGGIQPPFVLESGSFSIPNIINDVGNYSFNITTEFETEEECCTSFDVSIARCRVLVFPSGISANICGKFYEVEIGGQSSLFGTGNIGDTGLEQFTIYSNLSNSEIENILPIVEDEASYSTDEIKDFGSTEGLIFQQNEVTSDKDLVFKFDQNGNMVWVCKSRIKSISNKEEFKAEEKENNSENAMAAKIEEKVKLDNNISSIQPFPNPFRNELNIKFHSNIAQEITIQMMNTNGQRIMEKRITVIKGNNKINLISDSNKVTASGLYFLQVIEDSGNTISKQVIKIN